MNVDNMYIITKINGINFVSNRIPDKDVVLTTQAVQKLGLECRVEQDGPRVEEE